MSSQLLSLSRHREPHSDPATAGPPQHLQFLPQSLLRAFMSGQVLLLPSPLLVVFLLSLRSSSPAETPCSKSYPYMYRQLRIVVWNTACIPHQHSVLATFVAKHDADLVFLCKTHLATHNHFFLSSYTCYHQDHSSQPCYPASGSMTDIVHR